MCAQEVCSLEESEDWPRIKYLVQILIFAVKVHVLSCIYVFKKTGTVLKNGAQVMFDFLTSLTFGTSWFKEKRQTQQLVSPPSERGTFFW